MHSECLWLVKRPPLTTICTRARAHTIGWDDRLEISGWTSAEGLMKGSHDKAVMMCFSGLSWNRLSHQAISIHLPSCRTLPCSNHVQAIPFSGGPFLILRANANSWWRSYKHINLPLLPVPACTRLLHARKKKLLAILNSTAKLFAIIHSCPAH